MKPQVFKQVIKMAHGPDITIETGALAKQAHGSVVITCGKAMLLGTVVSGYKSTGLDFLPLTVDYREKFAAAGKYPGGFFKREPRILFLRFHSCAHFLSVSLPIFLSFP
jgi:polyribonucleotide nucleotidyltransferase